MQDIPSVLRRNLLGPGVATEGSAIQFDYELCFRGTKINNVLSDGMPLAPPARAGVTSKVHSIYFIATQISP